MPEPVYFFWGAVAVLAIAAAVNHGWHHARSGYLHTRLTRLAVRHDGHVVADVAVADDLDGVPGA